MAKMQKKAVVTLFKVLSLNLFGRMEENHETNSRIAYLLAEISSRNRPNTKQPP
jgi:hypothetical protein